MPLERKKPTGIFTIDALNRVAWVDEVLEWLGGDSIDWTDIEEYNPGTEEFIEMWQAGENGIRLDMTTLRDMEQRYLAQAGTSRIFIPRPFVASPTYNALGTPWFLDYVHLSS